MEKIPTKQLLGDAVAHRTGSPLKEVQPSLTVAAEKPPEPHFHPHPITSAGATKGLASRTTHSAYNDWQEKLIRTTAGAGLSLVAVPTPPGLDALSAGGSQTPAASPPRRCSQRW